MAHQFKHEVIALDGSNGNDGDFTILYVSNNYSHAEAYLKKLPKPNIKGVEYRIITEVKKLDPDLLANEMLLHGAGILEHRPAVCGDDTKQACIVSDDGPLAILETYQMSGMQQAFWQITPLGSQWLVSHYERHNEPIAIYCQQRLQESIAHVSLMMTGVVPADGMRQSTDGEG